MHSIQNPWYKTSLHLNSNGIKLSFKVPHDVFSGQQIDEGTLLLLGHLPSGVPKTVLDMGCGYGALGLPIAFQFPTAQIEMVDRDLLAVDWSDLNATENGLKNVKAYGSLGYRDLQPPAHGKYDWILCNVPARIGTPFIENLINEGRTRLSPGGEIRVVVIRDLGPTLLALKEKNNWPLTEVAVGPRHTVFSITAEAIALAPAHPDDLYFRDRVEVESLILDRPFDLGGDDPKRLKSGLPVLLDALPRQVTSKAPFKVLSFRCGYGATPLTCRKRWPEALIVAADRDLLATAFTKRNAETFGLSGPLLEIREAVYLQSAIKPDEKFDLILCELSPSTGDKVIESEILSISSSLKKGGEALLLCLDKLEKQCVRPFAEKQKLRIYPVIARDGYTVLRVAGLTA